MLLASLAAIGAPPPGIAPLDVQMHFSSARVLLGQPVWIVVEATNRTANPLVIDFGDACMDTRPLRIHVPDAAPGPVDRSGCGGMLAGNCMHGIPPVIAPGETLSKQYVLAGDFRITRPGAYQISLEKPLRYGSDPHGDQDKMFPKEELTFDRQLTLEVLPPNPRRLLDVERELAARAATSPVPRPVPSGDIDAIRRADDAWTKANYNDYFAKRSIAEGLAAYPLAGMEQTFLSALDKPTVVSDFALLALFNLNTADARKILGLVANGSIPTQQQSAPWEAVRYLGDMGDRSYLTLIERLAVQGDSDVNLQAILALAHLGGDAEVSRLAAISKSGEPKQRRMAITALGQSGSRQAIAPLIELFRAKGLDQPGDSSYALSTLTHRIPFTSTVPTAEQAQADWQSWWARNEQTTRIYGPYECDPRSPRREWSPFA